MDVDCNNLLDLCLTRETTATLFDSVWPEEYILSTNNKEIADDNDERDMQDLFDGAANPEINQDDDNASSLSWGAGLSSRDMNKITDQEIANLWIQELNKLLRNLPREEAARIRRRRRNLKNRRYSLSCRLRKQREHEDLINENTSLKKKLEDGKCKLLKVEKEKEVYKRK